MMTQAEGKKCKMGELPSNFKQNPIIILNKSNAYFMKEKIYILSNILITVIVLNVQCISIR